MIGVRCQCGTVLNAPISALGQKGRCPNCGRTVLLQSKKGQIRIECFCGKMLTFPITSIGKTGHCSECGASIFISSNEIVKTECPCGKTMVSPKSLLGKVGRCTGCGRALEIGASSLLLTRCICGRGYFSSQSLRGEKIICRSCGIPLYIGSPPPLVNLCSCGQRLVSPRSALGKRIICPACKKTLQAGVIPKASIEEEKSEPLIETEPQIEADVQPEMKTQDESLTQTEPQKQMEIDHVVEAQVQPEVIEQPIFTGPINFKCSCGQPHLVDGSQVGKHFTCFRCKETFEVPKPEYEEEREGTIHFKCRCGQHHTLKKSLAGTSYLCFRCGKESIIQITLDESRGGGVSLTNPYQIPDPYKVLGIEYGAGIDEIKASCRKIQTQQDRTSSGFQSAQEAKERLTKPEERLWYEIISAQKDISGLWDKASNQTAKLHYRNVKLHQDAISLEMERVYHKADTLWEKVVAGWLSLIESQFFWETVHKRGEAIFPRFKEKTVDEIKKRIVPELILSIHGQFRDHYYGESNIARARRHLGLMEPALRYSLDRDPSDTHILRLLIEVLMARIEQWSEEGRLKKALKEVQSLLNLAPGAPDVRRFASDVYAGIGQDALNRGKKDEGEKYIKLAMEIDPDKDLSH